MSSHTSLADAHHLTVRATTQDLIDERYQLVDVLAANAQAETWTAHDLRLSRRVQIELIFSTDSPSPPEDRLQQVVNARSGRSQMYDAGSHTLPAGFCTFVVTPVCGPALEVSAPDVSLRRMAVLDGLGSRPLSISEWATPVTTHRGRKRTGAHVAETLSLTGRLSTRLRRVKDVGADSLTLSVANLATNIS